MHFLFDVGQPVVQTVYNQIFRSWGTMVQKETQQQKKAAEKLLEPRGKDGPDHVACQMVFRVIMGAEKSF